MGPYLASPNKDKHAEDFNEEKVSNFFDSFSYQTGRGFLKFSSGEIETVYLSFSFI